MLGERMKKVFPDRFDVWWRHDVDGGGGKSGTLAYYHIAMCTNHI